jgi:CubicO group peptidase (beta-lactamase class C family)
MTSWPLIPIILLSSACASRTFSAHGARTSPSSTARLPFAPGMADATQKSKLAELEPKLDAYFQNRVTQVGATGLSVGIIVGGELVYAKGFGSRVAAAASPVDRDTVFRIGSLTKSFTALAVLKLRDEGKLRLDDPAVAYLPELRALRAATTDSADFTIRQLLTHTSGLPSDDAWGSVSFGFGEEDLNRLIASGLSLSAAPGTHWEYSNLGYAFLGRIIERVSKVGFRDYVTANILLPLGMTSTRWESADVPSQRLAIGYFVESSRLVPALRPSDGVFAPAGGLYTSMRDYARYVGFNLAAYPARNGPEAGPVRRSSVREMHEAHRWFGPSNADLPIAHREHGRLELSASSYGFGWRNVTTCSESGSVEHSGGEPGYFAAVELLPGRNFGIVTLATTHGVHLVSEAVELIRDAGALPASPVLAASPPLLDARERIARLLTKWSPALAASVFDPTATNYPWYRSLPTELARLSHDHGPCSFGAPFNADTQLHGKWTMKCANGTIEFEVFLTPAVPPRVAELSWREDFPATLQLSNGANSLAAAFGNPSDGHPPQVLAVSLSRAEVARVAGLLAGYRGPCVVERALASNGHNQGVFRVNCLDTSLDLSITIDEVSGAVTDVDAALPNAPIGTCRQ